MRVALYEPDIPQNTGAVLRLAACMGVAVDIIEPCGFVFDDRRLRRAGMDYLHLVERARHASWRDYLAQRHTGRLILMTTSGDIGLHDCAFEQSDTLLFGRESAGVPPEVHAAADARVVIPMAAEARSLNVALAAAIALTEALRQTGALPRMRTVEPA